MAVIAAARHAIERIRNPRQTVRHRGTRRSIQTRNKQTPAHIHPRQYRSKHMLRLREGRGRHRFFNRSRIFRLRNRRHRKGKLRHTSKPLRGPLRQSLRQHLLQLRPRRHAPAYKRKRRIFNDLAKHLVLLDRKLQIVVAGNDRIEQRRKRILLAKSRRSRRTKFALRSFCILRLKEERDPSALCAAKLTLNA